MDLVTINSEDLGVLRPDDYFFEPASRKIYQYRNKEGKAIIVREVGTSTITKLFKNVLKTVLKVEGDFDKYQVISIDSSLTLFNANIGESFEVGFGDADNIDEIKEAFNRGDEIVAEIFDYDDIKETINLSIASTAGSSEASSTEAKDTISKEEMARIKEIEDKKAKKRPFGSAPAPSKQTPKKPASKAPAKATKAPAKKEVKKAEKVEKPKEETKEEKKAREKREKEEQKAREKAEKEAKKAQEKAEKEAKKKKK